MDVCYDGLDLVLEFLVPLLVLLVDAVVVIIIVVLGPGVLVGRRSALGRGLSAMADQVLDLELVSCDRLMQVRDLPRPRMSKRHVVRE